jgi:K+:H+ antiporter
VLETALLELAMLFALCVGGAVAVHRMRLPPVVAFLVTGAVVGPHSLAIVQHEEMVRQLAEVGVVVLLFTVGVELPFGQMVRLRRAILVGGGLQIGATIAVCAGLCIAFGIAWQQAVFLGFLLSLSSTAAVTKILTDQGEFATPHGRTAVGICLAQDLAVVPMILVLPLLGGGGGGEGSVVWSMLRSFGLLLATAAVAWLLAPRIFDLVARTRSRELFVLTLATLCLSLAAATAHFGMSLALGAFLAGILVADSDYHHEAMAEVQPFRDALSSLFFVSIGMLFDWHTIAESPGIVLAALIAVLGGKAIVVLGSARAVGLPFWFQVRTASTMAQVGEFSFVLVGVAGSGGMLPQRVEKVFLVVAVLSIAATPLLYGLGKFLARRARGGGDAGRSGDSGARDHAVLVGFGPTGQAVAGGLRNLGIAFTAIEMNAATVRSWKQRGFPILLGDSTRVPVLAINDGDAARRTARLARKLAPQIHVIARATYLAEVALLHQDGAQEVVPQELETSVEILARVLRRFLVTDDEVGRQIRVVRDAAGIHKEAAPAYSHVERIGEFVPGIGIAIHRVVAGAEVAGRALAEAGVRRRTGCSVIAVRRGNDNLPIVEPDTVMAAGDIVVLIGPETRLPDAAAMFQPGAVAPPVPPSPVVEAEGPIGA